ncbi:MAG TPA: hypothetical protein VK607_06770, partial [Kofleriaceae bacterium]|nr:hypothetical protein [Kofleriaceae bacterium]
RALSLGQTNAGTWYLIHNNLGYCMNQVGRYEEGEAYCRTATEIDPKRANAFKNLGLSLQGQGRLAAAAGSFVDAVKANASDPRALKHLEDLVAAHRAELAAEIQDLDELLDQSRLAVRTAARVNEELRRAKKQ